MSYKPMVRTMFNSARRGRRRGRGGIMTSAFCLLLISTMIAGCSLDSPSSPNTSGDLTGQTTNQQFSFSGTIGVTSFVATLAADDTSTVTITAEVKNDTGDPVNNFTTVIFRTDLGAFALPDPDNPGNRFLFETVSIPTFNGLAQVEFQSLNRAIGTANIVASVGTTTASTEVVLEPAAISGLLSLGFGTGTGPITDTGQKATQNAPIDVTVGVTAVDLAGLPIPGAKVRFNIVQDTTDEGSPNDAAHWLASSSTNTGALGDAVNIVRVYGSGVVVMDADLIDPVTGERIAKSNRIILTTGSVLILKHTFADGSSTFTGNAPLTVGLVATVFDATNAPQAGLDVRWTIVTDGTTGATLSKVHGTTDASGRTTSSLKLPSVGTVEVRAALFDASNTEIQGLTITAIGQ